MTVLKVILHSSIVFLAAWAFIPFIMEIIPKIRDFIHLARKKARNEVVEEMRYQPEITLVIPTHNSASNLYRCIKSIHDSTYDKKQMDILFVDDKSTDNSFDIFCQCQEEFRDLKMNWIQSKQGKSHALNLAMYNSYGKYVIHIDCAGVLHPEAIYNIVRKFETHPEVHCMTGAIMTNPKMIEETKSFFMRLLRKVEYFDYCQDFFAGHNFKSELDNSFTLKGAFFGFRRSTILKTQICNTENISDDMFVTFRMGELGHEKIALCNDAIFFVNPIETLDSLYTQRRRWQQGEIKVLHMFDEQRGQKKKGYFSDLINRLFIFDHAFAFPRMIWYLALICLGFVNYSFHLIMQASAIMYGAYVLSTVLLYLCIVLFLCPYRNLQAYNARKLYMIFLLPIYNLMIYGMRLVGAINSKVAFATNTNRSIR